MKQINISFNEEEKKLIIKIAKLEGLSFSAIVRRTALIYCRNKERVND